MTNKQKLNPYKLFLRVMLIIAIVEFIVMILLNALNIKEGVLEYLADSLMLSVLSAPFLYYFVIKGVSRSIQTEARLHEEAMERELINKSLTEKIALKQHSEDIVKSVLSGIMVISKEHIVVSANPSSHSILNTDVIVGRHIENVLTAASFKQDLKEVLETGADRRGIAVELNDGENIKHINMSITVIHSSLTGETKQALIVIDDITKHMDDERTIFMMAYYDALTGLPNRLMLMDRMSQALASAKRGGDTLALLFLDLDHFKFINDTLGHEAGDELLKIVATKLKGCLRISDTVARALSGKNKDDSTEDMVARLGGDEFIVLLPCLSKDVNAINIANRILAAFDSPVTIKGHELFITTSIGVSMYPSDGDNIEDLLKKADMSMYLAKEEGRNNCKLYNASLDLTRKDWLNVEYKLHKALELHEFVLYYQPQVNLATGNIVGVEGLIRWQDPETELIPPGRFIPIAEETGLIIPITAWVLKTACAQANAWRLKTSKNVRVSVNISMRQFKEKDFVANFSAVLKESGLPPELLEIELTESIVMTNAEHTIKILHNLKKIGIRLAIDDFGTGFSSLSYLKSMPIDIIKIDRSFIRDIPSNKNDVALTTAIIHMAHSLGIEVIAEGVETKEQYELLKKLGCDNIQGYLFMKPSGEQEVEAFMAKWEPSEMMKALERTATD